MHIPEEAPPLNPWPFLIGDAVLIATACFIASEAPAPLAAPPLAAIVACIGIGAALSIIPFLTNHARRQEIALAERLREISALAQTTANSAEQLSIAASNLHAISESTARSIKLAETLPHRLQDKINEFKTQLNEVAVTENESLTQEINTLRASETERLESALAGVRKTVAELGSLDASIRKQFKELSDAFKATIDAAEKTSSASAKSLEQARAAGEHTLLAAQASAVAAVEKAVADALSQIERKVAQAAETFSANLSASVSSKPVPESSAIMSTPVAREESVFHPPSAPVAGAPCEVSTPTPLAAAVDTPTAPALFAADLAAPASEDVPVVEKPARKRVPRKADTGADNHLPLGLDLSEPTEDYSQVAPERIDSAVSADGITRLVVTAYIGIGNKLFVRGDGPGLSWDHGTPLQFVSIGKWRWESPEVASPVTLKLYKNDELECTAIGTLTILPGHQQSVTANFN